MEGLERVVREHPFFAGLDDAAVKLLAGCAKNVRFEPGEILFREGEPADQFYLLRQGRVELSVKGEGRCLPIQTVGADEMVGASWLVPPYRWRLQAQAVELTRALALDATCLRGKCEADHSLGYEMMKRFMPILIHRLAAARLQLLEASGIKG